MKADLSDSIGDRICETVRVAREVGGSDIGTVLRTLSELLRSDARTRAELETRQGWVMGIMTAAVAIGFIISGLSTNLLTLIGSSSILFIGGILSIVSAYILYRYKKTYIH